MRPNLVSHFALLFLLGAPVALSAQSSFTPCDDPNTKEIEACTECDSPDTEEIEFCCPDPLNAVSCPPCDLPDTATNECDSEPPGSDGNQVVDCSGGIICHETHSVLELLLTDLESVVIASGVKYTQPVPADVKRATSPVEITVVATVPCVRLARSAPVFMMMITPLNGKGPAIVLLTAKRPFQGTTNRMIGETTFITAAKAALMFTYKQADGSVRTMVVSGVQQKEWVGSGANTLMAKFQARLIER